MGRARCVSANCARLSKSINCISRFKCRGHPGLGLQGLNDTRRACLIMVDLPADWLPTTFAVDSACARTPCRRRPAVCDSRADNGARLLHRHPRSLLHPAGERRDQGILCKGRSSTTTSDASLISSLSLSLSPRLRVFTMQDIKFDALSGHIGC